MVTKEISQPKIFSLRNIFGPLFLMSVTPVFAFLVWFININCQGSVENFYRLCSLHSFSGLIQKTWLPIFFGTPAAWCILLTFAAFQILLLKIVPGKEFFGPITPKGNIPKYKENGFSCFFITIVTFLICSCVLKIFSPTILYDHFAEMISALNLFSFLFCTFLYFKGRFFPSSSDCGLSGNPILDFYWGTELYPRIGFLDLKQFTNCRFGMMIWPVLLLSYAFKQKEIYGLSDSMVIAVALQFIYIGKFFMWEKGYLRSLDIMHDRAGYYICWGCLVWVPSVYTSSTLFLVHNPNNLGILLSLAIFSLGAAFILMNYAADMQRLIARASNGESWIFGKKPVMIKAEYYTETGEKKQNLLLASGFWAIARHFHYIPELLGALFWTLPALFISPVPYFYFVFLTMLLVDRANRDDARCQKKYGKAWDEYREKVPYKMIPFIY